MRVLLLTPPMTQLNTPYPATAYLTGFLRRQGRVEVSQADPAIELALRLFSRSGLERVVNELESGEARTRGIRAFLERKEEYLSTIDVAIGFLQGKNPSLALRIVGRDFLPEGPRFSQALEEFSLLDLEEDPLQWAFGALGVHDRAKYLASLYLDDVADVIAEGIDPRFSLSRYGEKLAASQPSFDPLRAALESEGTTLVDRILDEITAELIAERRPDLVGLSVPFPGNVYGALRIARTVRRIAPPAKIILGGGYVNTELRDLQDPALFDYIDYLTFDDGELPILRLIEHLEGKRGIDELCRTTLRLNGALIKKNDTTARDIAQKDVGTPIYDGLPIDRYLSIFEMLNPMHRIWSDGRWNKLTAAHGCYWKKCGFCDIHLDYIGRYDPSSAEQLVERMEAVMKETGQSGFHFVDEALPPAIARALSLRLIEKRLPVTWWGNIRFEKTFDAELTQLMAASGCVAVSGGLEVASDRLLKLMNKGVSVEQVARVTHAFSQAGILVHAYLMYGFPTQTEQETLDALERVRQLFEAGCIQSAYWHRFSATAHSPIGRNPEKYGIRLRGLKEPVRFARNDLEFEDPTPCDHDRLGIGLKRALYNYMHGVGIDAEVRFWFSGSKKNKMAPTQVRRDLVARAIAEPSSSIARNL